MIVEPAFSRCCLRSAGAAGGVAARGAPAATGHDGARATLMLAMSAFVALAFATLMTAYVVSDFSVINVVENTHTESRCSTRSPASGATTRARCCCGCSCCAVFGARVALFGDNLPPRLRARVLAVQGMIAVGFLAFILFTSNPFLRSIRRRPRATASTRCCRIPASPSIRRSSTSAMSASRSPSPSPSPR